MSESFVKETEDEADLPGEPQAIPSSVKNYMTPEGHRRMQDKLRKLLQVERPKVVETVAWAAGNGDRSENGDYIYDKRRLREIDRRIRFLSKRLECRGGRPKPAEEAGPGLFRRDRHLRHRARDQNEDHDRRRRRGRSRLRPGELAVTGRQSPDESASG